MVELRTSSRRVLDRLLVRRARALQGGEGSASLPGLQRTAAMNGFALVNVALRGDLAASKSMETDLAM